VASPYNRWEILKKQIFLSTKKQLCILAQPHAIHPSASVAKQTVKTSFPWNHNGSQVRPINSLNEIYSLLFHSSDPKAKKTIELNMVSRESVLDLVRDQAKSYSKNLGKVDREKLDQYFTSIRELENKVAQSRLWLDKPKPVTSYALPANNQGMTLKEKTPLFYDLMLLALQTDSTRVISLSFSGLGSKNGGFPEVSHDYHSLTHHGQEQSAINELAVIESFLIGQFGRFVQKLKEIHEPNGKTLLDNTMALFGSGMSNANSHSNRNLPILFAGGGYKHGSYKDYRNGNTSAPLCNLYLSMLQNFGLEIDKFNMSTGTLTGLEMNS
jgi:hypothetical protein